MPDKVCSDCGKSFYSYFTERDKCWYCANYTRMHSYGETGIITTDIIGLLNFCKIANEKDAYKFCDEIGVVKLHEVFKQMFQEIECNLKHVECALKQFTVKRARELKLLLRDENKFLLRNVYKCIAVNTCYHTTYLDTILILHVDLFDKLGKGAYLTIVVCDENSELFTDILYIQSTKDNALKIINTMMEEEFALLAPGPIKRICDFLLTIGR